MPSKYKRKSAVRSPAMVFVATEGEVTEPQYFKGLTNPHTGYNSSRFRLVIIPSKNGGSSPHHIITNAKEELKNYSLNSNDTVYVVVDRDNFIEKEIKIVNSNCKKSGFEFIMSNPNFELWLLLHHKDLADYSESEIEQIKENRKNHPKARRGFISKELLRIHKSYNKSNIRIEDYLKHTYTAIQRAKGIDDPDLDWPNEIGTRVYKVVERIIELSKEL